MTREKRSGFMWFRREARRDRRYSCPGAQVEIAGRIYPLENLSLGGFCADFDGGLHHGGIFDFTLHLPMRLHTLELSGTARTVRTAGGHLGAQFRSSGYRFMMDLNFYIHALKDGATPYPVRIPVHGDGLHGSGPMHRPHL
jgi:hypothetical protein